MANDDVDPPGDEASSSDRVGELLRRLAAGDPVDLAAVYDATSARVYGDILGAVGDPTASGEALQDTYLEVWKTAADYEPWLDGTAWVRSIAQRTAAGQASDAAAGDGSPGEVTPDGGPVAPPLTARSALMSRIAATPQGDDPAPASAADESESRPPAVDPAPTTNTIQAIQRTNWTRGLLVLVASMALLVALGFAAATINEILNRTPADAALADIEASPDSQAATGELAEGGTVTLRWSDSVGTAVIESARFPAIADDQAFAVWLVRDDTPESAGTFERRSDGTTTVIVDSEIEAGDVVTVTVEPAEGVGDEPSGDPIVTIPTA